MKNPRNGVYEGRARQTAKQPTARRHPTAARSRYPMQSLRSARVNHHQLVSESPLTSSCISLTMRRCQAGCPAGSSVMRGDDCATVCKILDWVRSACRGRPSRPGLADAQSQSPPSDVCFTGPDVTIRSSSAGGLRVGSMAATAVGSLTRYVSLLGSK